MQTSFILLLDQNLERERKKYSSLAFASGWNGWITACFTLYLCFNCCFNSCSKMHTVSWKGYWWFVESSITFLMLCCSHSFCWSNSFSFSSRSSISASRYLSLSTTSFVLQPAPTPLKKSIKIHETTRSENLKEHFLSMPSIIWQIF